MPYEDWRSGPEHPWLVRWQLAGLWSAGIWLAGWACGIRWMSSTGIVLMVLLVCAPIVVGVSEESVAALLRRRPAAGLTARIAARLAGCSVLAVAAWLLAVFGQRD